MKMFKSLLLTGAILLAGLMALPVEAADGNSTAFSGAGVSNATPLAYFVTSAAPAGVPKFQQISAYSDKATAVLQFYSSTNNTSATNGSTVAAGTNTIWCSGGTNFAANDIVVIRYSTGGINDFYERNKVSGTPTVSNIVLTWVTKYPLTSGDKIYKMTADAKIPMFGLTNVTVSPAAGAIYYGQEGRPTLVELDATTSGSIYSVAGEYWRRPRP